LQIIPRANKLLYLSRKKGIYTIYTTIKPFDKKSTYVFIEIIEFLFQVNIRTVVGDGSITTKKILRECKELGIEYIGKIRKNIIIEFFGRRVKIEELFDGKKFKLRTINGIEFRLSDKVVNIPNVGRVKIVAVLMGNQKKPKYLVATNYKKKAENIVIEYMKRPKIEEKHKRDKSILEIEGNYLTSEKSNIGFIRFMAIVSNCIEYLSYKYGLSFYKVVKECSKELIKKGLP